MKNINNHILDFIIKIVYTIQHKLKSGFAVTIQNI